MRHGWHYLLSHFIFIFKSMTCWMSQFFNTMTNLELFNEGSRPNENFEQTLRSVDRFLMVAWMHIKSIMRLKDFSFAAFENWRGTQISHLLMLVIARQTTFAGIPQGISAKRAEHLKKVIWRKMHLRSFTFSIYSYSEQQSHREFFLCESEIRGVVELNGFTEGVREGLG